MIIFGDIEVYAKAVTSLNVGLVERFEDDRFTVHDPLDLDPSIPDDHEIVQNYNNVISEMKKMSGFVKIQ